MRIGVSRVVYISRVATCDFCRARVGDTVAIVSRLYNVSSQELMEINPDWVNAMEHQGTLRENFPLRISTPDLPLSHQLSHQLPSNVSSISNTPLPSNGSNTPSNLFSSLFSYPSSQSSSSLLFATAAVDVDSSQQCGYLSYW